LLTFVLPFTLLLLETFDEYPYVNTALVSIGMVSQIFFVFIEFIQIKVQGSDYWGFYNLCDISQIFIYAGYIVLKKLEHDQNDGTEGHIAVHKDNQLEIWMILTDVVLLSLIFFKIQNFLRIIGEFGFLAQMVTETFIDMRFFISYYLLWILFFTCINSILKVDPGVIDETDDPPVDYPGVNRYIALVLMTFRNAIGDLSPPEYGSWVTEVQEANGNTDYKMNWSQRVIVSALWLVWCLQVILMIIVLLNFLIAVISETYERVYGEKTICFFIDKAVLNLEYFQIIDSFQWF